MNGELGEKERVVDLMARHPEVDPELAKVLAGPAVWPEFDKEGVGQIIEQGIEEIRAERAGAAD